MAGPQSGVKINEELVKLFEGFKATGVKKHKHDYLTFVMKGEKVVQGECPEYGSCVSEEGIDSESPVPASYQSLKKYLIKTKAAFAFYIFNWNEKDGRSQDRVFGINYVSDDEAPMKLKMLHSTTKDTLKKAMGCEAFLQLNDSGDLNYKDLIKDISKGKAV